jgi:hypothetical protein
MGRKSIKIPILTLNATRKPNKTSNVGRKFMRFANTIETGRRYLGKDIWLIMFLLSNIALAELWIEDVKYAHGRSAVIRWIKNGNLVAVTCIKSKNNIL